MKTFLRLSLKPFTKYQAAQAILKDLENCSLLDINKPTLEASFNCQLSFPNPLGMCIGIPFLPRYEAMSDEKKEAEIDNILIVLKNHECVNHEIELDIKAEHGNKIISLNDYRTAKMITKFKSSIGLGGFTKSSKIS